MKILAIEKDLPGVKDEDYKPFLKAEGEKAWDLYKSGIIRELYFSDNNYAVLMLECKDGGEARAVLNTLPLVKEKLIDFEIIPLLSYTGFERLFKKRMTMKFAFVFILFICLNACTWPSTRDCYTVSKEDTFFIYLVKQYWHTGIVFEVKNIETIKWNEIKDFRNFKYIDVGWGDEEFYQYEEDFDLGLAIKAICYPTSSVLRIEGFNFEIVKYVKLSDYAIKIPITYEQLHTLYRYISNTYFKNKSGNTEILSERHGGNIKFYRAKNKYHLFNTCNTWIAKGLEEAGFNIKSSLVILSQDLFIQAERFGTVLKYEDEVN